MALNLLVRRYGRFEPIAAEPLGAVSTADD
jgi:hypothetical protein